MSPRTKVVGVRAPIIWLLIAVIVVVVAASVVGGLVVYPQFQEKRETQAQLAEAEQHYQAGVAFQDVGEWEAARGEYMQVITLDANYKDVQTRLDEVKAELTEAEATATANTQATATAQVQATAAAQAVAATATMDAVEAHYQKGLAYINLGKGAEAQVELEAVFEADPNYKDVQTELAKVEAGLAAIRALTPTAVPVTPTPEVQGFSYTTYEAFVRGTGYQTKPLGTHLFCASAGFAGPGGFNVRCKVYESEGVWFVEVEDTTSDQSTTCYAICFD